MRSQKSYLFLLLVVGLGILSGFFFARTQARYGLDVKGGVRLTYEMEFKDEKEKEQAEAERGRLIPILVGRAAGSLGVAEAPVVAKGLYDVVVELPGYQDIDKARQIIGTSAKIQFFWANNVVNQSSPYAAYTIVNEDKDPNNPSVEFKSSYGTPGTIKAGTPAYAAIIKQWGDPILEGEDLASAQSTIHGDKEEPEMLFAPAGADKMRTWSTKHENTHASIAAVLDGRVLSIASVVDNTILSDNAVIEGTFSHEYVKRLCDLLNGGALPVSLKELSSEKIDPTLGGNSMEKMTQAGVIAFGVIAAFLVLYYAFPGVVALLALSLYVLFALTVLKLTGATFSLAGIAGFILSVGMAVDANILVFERLKEEIKSGKKLNAAIELGFKRALPAIVDSNACTLLTSIVLYNLGTGPVKGFATTLIIGVLLSLFTAVTVTRSLLLFFVGSGIGDHESWYAVNRNWFGKKFDPVTAEPLVVVEKAKKWFGISLATIVISIPFFFMGGFKLNVEFQGGYQADFAVPANTLDANALSANLEKAGFKGGNVKLGSGKAKVNGVDQETKIASVTVPIDKRLTGMKEDADRENLLATSAGLTNASPLSFAFVGPEIQKETLQNAVEGVLLSSLLVVLYLAIRFGTGFGGFGPGMRFGVSAIGALVHDILVVIGTAAIMGFLLRWEISALFLTAMLTMIGFSVHDTIVIFDRIRENLRRPKPGEQFGHLMDRSITQSFARSINTSSTVIVTLLILVAFGTPTPELKFFVLAMMVGIISGTYSSIYNASPILFLWDLAIGKKKGADHTLVGMANAEHLRHQVITTRISEPEVQSASGRTYGQVRRRAKDNKQGHIEIEDEN